MVTMVRKIRSVYRGKGFSAVRASLLREPTWCEPRFQFGDWLVLLLDNPLDGDSLCRGCIPGDPYDAGRHLYALLSATAAEALSARVVLGLCFVRVVVLVR